jgi:hypothetical protein
MAQIPAIDRTVDKIERILTPNSRRRLVRRSNHAGASGKLARLVAIVQY